jgi:hypothetical protein
MQYSLSCEPNSTFARNSPHCTEAAGSVPCSQQPITVPTLSQTTPVRSSHPTSQTTCPHLRLFVTFCSMFILYSEELSAICPTSKLEGHPLSTACDCLLNTYTATMHIWGLSPPPTSYRCVMLWWHTKTHKTILLFIEKKLHWLYVQYIPKPYRVSGK